MNILPEKPRKRVGPPFTDVKIIKGEYTIGLTPEKNNHNRIVECFFQSICIEFQEMKVNRSRPDFSRNHLFGQEEWSIYTGLFFGPIPVILQREGMNKGLLDNFSGYKCIVLNFWE